MKHRTLDALRNLAERPGTEAEGRLARELLARAEKQLLEPDAESAFRRYMQTGAMDDLRDAVGSNVCDCGAKYPPFTTCPNTAEHARINTELRTRFPRGTRVYYNYWAYGANCPGNVTGYSVHWNWIRVKFDRLKTSRAVPIYGKLGWHLSTEPLPEETRTRRLRGITEEMEENLRRIREIFGRENQAAGDKS